MIQTRDARTGMRAFNIALRLNRDATLPTPIMMESNERAHRLEGLPGHTFSAISDRLMDRAYLQLRVHEEIERSLRYKREFSLLLCESSPNDGVPLRRKIGLGVRAIEHVVRTSDIIALVYEDIIAVLLIETGAAGLGDALFRIRQRLNIDAGAWRFSGYSFPGDEAAIRSLAFLTAA